MSVGVEPHAKFPGVYWATSPNGSRKLCTKNLTPRRKVYGEQLISSGNYEFRAWDPYRSKLAAAILKGLTKVPVQPGHRVLYLGAASGTTASHVSDIVGERGHVYCVEFAAHAMRDLVTNVSSIRENITPILEDARQPKRYAIFVNEVDDIYCDIAQPEQARILSDNADLFLKKQGWSMLAVKSQSIDVTRKPTDIYRQEIGVLKSRGFRIREVLQLEPYDKAHAMIVSKI
ncbi:MAG: fibrillarin-like rRNA/tRNA 2'-O-methyltransferase [Candidatus Bathyarchaeota archaeon]|nr:MAG: fibrillarin-like rRNA/tRNA 2'-O-methyltransferase [Candidatus Bathyarchaeota archaeon]